MESKKMNRNLFSVFWCILYFMPVLVLLLSLVGNYIIYKDSANNLKVEYQETHIEDISRESGYFLNNTIYTNGLFYATWLTDDLVLNKILDANFAFEDIIELPGVSYFLPYVFNVINGDDFVDVALMTLKMNNVYAIGTINVAKMDDFLNYFNLIWCSDSFELNGFTISKGWSISSFTEDYLLFGRGFDFSTFDNFTVQVVEYFTEEQQNIIHPLFTPRPSAKYVDFNYNGYFQFDLIQQDNTYYMSFFDISMFNTDNTFKKFQLPFLRNGFEKVFGLLQFENSFTSSFVITTLTWFIQFMLLHVIVDTLTFIFKLYHKLMEKVV